MGTRISTAENGLGEQPCGVWMNEEMTILANHHEISMGIRVFRKNGLRQIGELEIGRDNTDKLTVRLVERLAIGSDNLLS